MKKVLMVLLLLAGVWAYSTQFRTGWAAALERELARGTGHAFALADLSELDWDRVFLFGPYTNRDQIEAALGFPWPGDFRSRIELSDGVVLMVLVRGGEVVDWCDVPRSPVDLAPSVSAGRKGVERGAARFAVESGALILQTTPREE